MELTVLKSVMKLKTNYKSYSRLKWISHIHPVELCLQLYSQRLKELF